MPPRPPPPRPRSRSPQQRPVRHGEGDPERVDVALREHHGAHHGERVDVALTMAHALSGNTEPLTEKAITLLVLAARKHFEQQSSLLELDAPVNIAGDVHGQFEDLMRIFAQCGRLLFWGV